MAQINILGNAAVITSGIKTEDIQKLQKYNPAGLVLKDKDDKAIFMVTTGEQASVSNNGIVFNGTSRDGNGYATATFDIGDVEDAKAYIVEKVGFSILRLNELESAIVGSVDEINGKLGEVEASINVMGVTETTTQVPVE